MDFYGFYTGKIFDAYEFLGAHPDKDGTTFRTFAPAASRITVIGEFNDWQEWELNKTYDGNFWECYAKGAKPGMMYKYRIYRQDGNCVEHCDPYGFGMELRPNFASIIRDLSHYKFKDSKWMQKRSVCKDKPLNIYELHFGSFKKPSEKADDWYTYVEMIDILIPYLKENDYNYIEIMPLSEHPCDESWGYQNTGFFSPTSRYGTAEELMKFIDACHKNDIGVIMDFVPVHFAVDHYALADYDGTSLYEYPHQDVGVSEWGSCNFMHSRGETRSFLQSCANYWISEFHMDGIRMDAVASMLYLDYGRENGQWTPNIYGGNKNLEAIEFFKHLNSVVLGRNHGAMMIAEESTAWPKVTGKPEEDGLGFSHKWNMGWMNDFLEYMKLDPYFRKWNHNKMTFSMTYAYAEKYILVLSHDEVVHLKCSMINKMPGLYDDKFANLRAGYAYMLGHPGKKLLFMGQEFAQLQEWSEARELDWYLLAEDKHQQMQNYVKALLHLYKKTPALYDADQDPCGFEWINADDADRSIFSFVRHSKDGKSNLLFVINFTPVARPDYRVGVPKRKQYRLVLDGDAAEFGGNTTERPVVYKAVKSECDGREYSFAYDLPAYGIAIFKF